MKRILLALLLSLFCFNAAAQTELRRPPSSPDHVAMTFFKLAGRTPDFEAWVRDMEAYKTASLADQPGILAARIGELRGSYTLLTAHEPVIVEMPVTLSDYSAANKGFFVRNFKDETFFPVRQGSRFYAVVPSRITDRQWISVPDESRVRAIEQARDSLIMVMTLIPAYADAREPAVIDGTAYWLMAADVQKMALYAAKDSSPLWTFDVSGGNDAKKQELLKLRQ